jgi:hypothetical protein
MARLVFLLLLLASALGVVRAQFYPENHFDYVTKIKNKEELLVFINSNIEQDKTVFVRWILSTTHPQAVKQAPAWNYAAEAFAGPGNDYGVVFGDVNMDEADENAAHRHAPGGGGWPTIRFFTKQTEYKGGRYVQKTEFPLCQELADRHWMLDYVESKSRTVLCGTLGTHCNEKEKAFLEKMNSQSTEARRKQLDRLDGMMEKPMKAELEEWVFRRIRILEKLIGARSNSRIGDARYRKPHLDKPHWNPDIKRNPEL